MARGVRKHLKRINAPSHWLLDKLTGVYAPHPRPGPHKLRECLPICLLLRERLKYAFTKDECTMICMQRLIKIDGKVRTDDRYPMGFMDVVQIAKTAQNFRMLLDPKGRFVPHAIRDEEAKYKLCRVKQVAVGANKIPYAVTHDNRTIRYIDPNVKRHDTIRLDLEEGKVTDYIKFELGNLVMVTGGHNVGRVGTIFHREKHPGSFEIVHVRDSRGQEFATRIANVFVIGKGSQPWVSLPKDKGIRCSIIEDRQRRLAKMNRA